MIFLLKKPLTVFWIADILILLLGPEQKLAKVLRTYQESEKGLKKPLTRNGLDGIMIRWS